MIKKRIIKHLIIIFSLILMCNSLSFFAKASDEAVSDKDLIPVYDYVLVCMEHDYSFPDKDYEPSYFGEEYVERLEAILTYTDGCLADKNEFCRIEKLYLTEFGQENLDLFIEQLNARPDILCAERDYKTTQAFMDHEYLMGDSNLDGVIDTSDARQVLRWAIDLDNYTNLNEALCDVNYDNVITTSDARLILQMAIGSIDPIQ